MAADTLKSKRFLITAGSIQESGLFTSKIHRLYNQNVVCTTVILWSAFSIHPLPTITARNEGGKITEMTRRCESF